MTLLHPRQLSDSSQQIDRQMITYTFNMSNRSQYYQSESKYSAPQETQGPGKTNIEEERCRSSQTHLHLLVRRDTKRKEKKRQQKQKLHNAMQKGDSAVAPPCLLHVIVVELRDSLLLFPHLCTICSLAPMSCYFSELSALLACLFKGTKYGLEEAR